MILYIYLVFIVESYITQDLLNISQKWFLYQSYAFPYVRGEVSQPAT